MSENPKNISQIHNLHTSGGFGFGWVTYRAGARLGPRIQKDYQLVVLHSGVMNITLGNHNIALSEGEGVLLQPGNEEYFEFNPSGKTVHSWCHLPPEMLPPSQAFAEKAFAQPAPASPWLLQFMQKGWTLNEGTRDMAHTQTLISATTMAMWDFCRNLPESGPPQSLPWPPPLVRVKTLLDQKLAEPLTLNDLVAAAGVSKGHLSELTHAHWSCTPMEYLWRLRIETATRLLRQTGLSISEVAYNTGFSNPFHFSRRFKQRHGQHPRAWRTAAWEGRSAI